MDPLYIQNLRYKLQKRVARLNSVEGNIFRITLRQFWRFFDQHPTLVGITEMLMAQFPDIDKVVEKILQREQLYGETEEEAAAIGHGLLRRFADDESIKLGHLPFHASGVSSVDIAREVLLEPFYEYVDEQLDDQRAMLALLIRYKHRSEWFHRDRLWDLSQTERQGEKLLAIDLYSYLYDQGIDFVIEPSSITGEVDLIAAQDTPDPVLLDAKIFDADGRGKSYIRKGFSQLYTYLQQHNEPFGYLVIYRITDRDLRFSLNSSGYVPMVVHNHKTIFLITIDIFRHEKPVSQRSPLDAIEIAEEELVGTLNVSENGQSEDTGVQ